MLKKTITGVELVVEIITLRDKRSMFRPSRPTEYVVQAMVGNGILFTRSYPTMDEAKRVYFHIQESCSPGGRG